MIKHCLRCDVEMTLADLTAGSNYAKLEQKDMGINSKVCEIHAYVCPNCGSTELVAKTPEIFKS